VNQISDDIAQVLAPVIGSGLAISMVNMQCKKMGISPDLLSINQLDDFTNMIYGPLELFAGPEIAEKITGEISLIKNR